MKNVHSNFDVTAVTGRHKILHNSTIFGVCVTSMIFGLLILAAKRYYRSCREEHSRQRRGVAAVRKDNRRKEERIMRVSWLIQLILTLYIMCTICDRI